MACFILTYRHVDILCLSLNYTLAFFTATGTSQKRLAGRLTSLVLC
jgi:hypothetical protein